MTSSANGGGIAHNATVAAADDDSENLPLRRARAAVEYLEREHAAALAALDTAEAKAAKLHTQGEEAIASAQQAEADLAETLETARQHLNEMEG